MRVIYFILMTGTNLLPSSDLIIAPKPWCMRISASFSSNKSTFADEQRTRLTSTLTVIFNSKVTMNVMDIGAITGEGCKDHSMVEGHLANLDGLEEFARRHYFVDGVGK